MIFHHHRISTAGIFAATVLSSVHLGSVILIAVVNAMLLVSVLLTLLLPSPFLLPLLSSKIRKSWLLKRYSTDTLDRI
jgi:hypothetical protein